MNIQFVLATILLVGIFGPSVCLSYSTPLSTWYTDETTTPYPDEATTSRTVGRKCTIERCVENKGYGCKPVDDADIMKSNRFNVTCNAGNCKTHVEVDYVEKWTFYKTYDQWGQECRCQSDGFVVCH
ncbi:uncharacterized protein LOC135493829 isoform X2 [Lineus longissimus]|uniref:uncharacterized protein LOC135493829 isoform X2 n=1 Tax=Lineus longissimus TaxID=88925 RepID=UPI00315C8548